MDNLGGGASALNGEQIRSAENNFKAVSSAEFQGEQHENAVENKETKQFNVGERIARAASAEKVSELAPKQMQTTPAVGTTTKRVSSNAVASDDADVQRFADIVQAGGAIKRYELKDGTGIRRSDVKISKQLVNIYVDKLNQKDQQPRKIFELNKDMKTIIEKAIDEELNRAA